MIRGLFIRQIFVLIDLALAAVVVATALAVGMKLFEAPPVMAMPAPSAATAANDASPFQVGDRTRYDTIIERGLFGAAGQFDPAAAAVPEPEPEAEVVATSFNLRLVGTTASSPTDRLASAIILNMDERGASKTYLLNEAVIQDEARGNVTLIEVYPRSVILLNAQEDPPTRERLSMDDAQPGAPAPALPVQTAAAADGSSNRITINRDEFVQELYQNYADLVTIIRPEYYRDAAGNVVGLTAQQISQVPLAQKLGLQDGDVLQSINNEQIDSEQKVMELFQRYRNASAFRIGILRNGRPQVITYRLE
ncbi:MAG TPA: type II secretion system protein N [Candidatus Hydrogenedentes bacterium]|nr:type II secretion system protein N [Candidatus Hydrogenedentota bacterium]